MQFFIHPYFNKAFGKISYTPLKGKIQKWEMDNNTVMSLSDSANLYMGKRVD